jgi:hypothetical protein
MDAFHMRVHGLRDAYCGGGARTNEAVLTRTVY